MYRDEVAEMQEVIEMIEIVGKAAVRRAELAEKALEDAQTLLSDTPRESALCLSVSVIRAKADLRSRCKVSYVTILLSDICRSLVDYNPVLILVASGLSKTANDHYTCPSREPRQDASPDRIECDLF
jgi:hypothetical protein